MHFPLVQALRGLAALWVVLFHAREGGHIDQLFAALPPLVGQIIFEQGYLGVPIFFALSGFVIAHSLRDVQLSAGTFGKFFLRRSLRLDPPYWASIVVVLILSFVSARVKHESFTFPGPGDILAHMGYVQLILHVREINPAYWTLTYEIQFYLFFAAALTLGVMLGKRWRPAVWGIMYLMALVSAAHGMSWLTPGLFPQLWAAFFAGVLAYKGIESPLARWMALPLVLPMLWTRDVFMLTSSATALLLWITSSVSQSVREHRWPVLERLGLISYSLYLMHNPITGAAGFVSRKLFGQSILADTATLLIILVASCVGATLFWWAVERPSHNLSRRIRLEAGKR